MKSSFLTSILVFTIVLSGCGPVSTSAPAKTGMPEAAALPSQTATAAPTTTPAPTNTPASTPTPTPVPSPTPIPVLQLGQVVDLNGVKLAAVDIRYTGAQVQVRFAALNTTDRPAYLSSRFYLKPAVEGDKPITPEFCQRESNEGKMPSIEGQIMPGENIQGSVCWQSGGDKVDHSAWQVEYIPGYGAAPLAFWDISQAATAPVPQALTVSSLPDPLPAGQAYEHQGIKVTFDSLGLYPGMQQIENNLGLLAQFSIENTGTVSFTLPSAMGSFKIRTADGFFFSHYITENKCMDTFSNVVFKPGDRQTFTVCVVLPFGNDLAPGTTARFVSPDLSWMMLWKVDELKK